MRISEIMIESIEHMHIMQELQIDIQRLTELNRTFSLRVNAVGRAETENYVNEYINQYRKSIWWDEFRCSTNKLKKTLAKRNALILQLEEKIKSGI